MKIVGYVTVGLVALVLGVVFSGYALSVLWSWFASPIFGLAELSVPEAIGVALIVSFLAREQPEENKESKQFSEILGRIFATSIMRPLGAIFAGWIITFFM